MARTAADVSVTPPRTHAIYAALSHVVKKTGSGLEKRYITYIYARARAHTHTHTRYNIIKYNNKVSPHVYPLYIIC
jgi:hypothetical protein